MISIKILFVTLNFPYPFLTGGSYRFYHLIKGCSNNHKIFLFSFNNKLITPENYDKIKNLCDKIHLEYRNKNTLKSLTNYISFFIQKQFMGSAFIYSKIAESHLLEFINSNDIDIAIFQGLTVAQYIPIIKHRINNKCKLIVDLSDIYSIFFNRVHPNKLEKKVNIINKFEKLNNMDLKQWESNILNASSSIIALTEKDKEIILREYDSRYNITVIPTGAEIIPYEYNIDKTRLIFVGSFKFYPNLEAMIYFFEKIFPAIIKKEQKIQIIVIGEESHKLLKYQEKYFKNIILKPFIENIEKEYKSSGICVVPTISGAGIRTKIIEAMSYGLPVICTALACEGINVTNGYNIIISDNNKDFAESTIHLLKDKKLRLAISKNAYKFIVNNYDWDTIIKLIDSI